MFGVSYEEAYNYFIIEMFEKGWLGEQKTQFKLWFSLSSKLYQRFHDVIIPSQHGTTQIDHILVSPFGLFVIETKNYTGWIYGSETQSNWTQVVYQSKYSFQNPLKQTYRHKKVLSKYLGVKDSHIKTVISFVGNVEFKTELPSNVLKSGLGSFIKQFREVVLSESEILRICILLKKTKSEVNISNEEHIQSLKYRHSSDTVCPNCGSQLVVRTIKEGDRKGSQFLGCKRYPRCKFTKKYKRRFVVDRNNESLSGKSSVMRFWFWLFIVIILLIIFYY